MNDQHKWILPFPISGKFRHNPLRNLNINIGSRDTPIYIEGVPYPPFPWALCRMEKTGDGKDSRFTPLSEPDDHSHDDPLTYWKLAQENGDVPQNIPAPEIPGMEDTEMPADEVKRRWNGGRK